MKIFEMRFSRRITLASAAQILVFNLLTPCFAEESSTKASPPSFSYVLPFQLRSVLPATSARLDSSLSFYNDKNGNSGGFTSANLLNGTYKMNSEFAISARIGIVSNNPPLGGVAVTSYTNPLLGVIYSTELTHDLRMGLCLGMTIPVGMGGGNSASTSIQSAYSAAILARTAMDNALFAVNYWVLGPGVDIAYASNGISIQLEATLLQLTRIQGELVDKDPARTNFTTGFNFSYSISPHFSLASELHYQRWLINDAVYASTNPAAENISLGIGPRFTFKAGNVTMKPGIAYFHGLVGPIASGGYTFPINSNKILFLDFPIAF